LQAHDSFHGIHVGVNYNVEDVPRWLRAQDKQKIEVSTANAPSHGAGAVLVSATIGREAFEDLLGAKRAQCRDLRSEIAVRHDECRHETKDQTLYNQLKH
jgi:hypothetical protein